MTEMGREGNRKTSVAAAQDETEEITALDSAT
jgi:hypothetical protein